MAIGAAMAGAAETGLGAGGSAAVATPTREKMAATPTRATVRDLDPKTAIDLLIRVRVC